MAKYTLLLIEDSPDDTEYYVDLLSQCSGDYRVITADNGEDGIAVFRKEQIDCTIIDYNMPGMDGMEILKAIQEIASGPVATIILTGEPHQTIQAEAARIGALDYMTKDAHSTPQKIQTVIEKTIRWASKI